MAHEQNIMKTNIPILYYPAIRGVAQPVRNLLYYLDIKFQQIPVVDNARQLEAGFNTGYPKLVHDQFDIIDVVAIFRHLCRYHKRTDLLGLTPQNRAMINEFLFHYADVRTKMTKKISEGAKQAWDKQNQGEIYEIKVSIVKVIVQQECKILKNCLQAFMQNKSWLMGYLTIMDFFFYEICFYLVNFLGSAMRNNLIYRNFECFINFFEQKKWFQLHKNEMTRKIFMPFKEKINEEIISTFWEGDKELIS